MYKKLLQLINQSIIYGIGTIFERLLGFILIPIFTHILSKADLGVYFLWVAYLATISIFYMLGMNSAIIRFYADSDCPEDRKKIFSTAFLSVLAIASILSLLIFLNSRFLTNALFDSETSETTIRIMAGVLLLSAVNMIALNVLKAENKASSFLWISVSSGVVMLGLTFFFLFILKQGLIGALYAILLADFFKFILLIVLVISRKLQFSFSLPDFKTMLNFGLPFIPTVLAMALMGLIDRYLLKKIAGIELVGIYGAGYRLAMVIGLMNKAFQYAWEPFVISTYQQPRSRELYAKVFTYFLIIISFVFLSVTLFIEQIVRLQIGRYTLFGADFYQSTQVVPILMLASVFYGCYLNFIVGIYIRKKTYYFMIITGGGVIVNFIVNILLIPSMGMQGAAWATVLAYAVMMLWLFSLNQRLFKIPYEFGRILKLIVLAGVILLSANLVKPDHWNTEFRLLLIFLFPISLLITGFFDKHELSRLRAILKGML